VSQPHTCPYCHSSNTVATLREATRQYYLCRDCRSAHGVPIEWEDEELEGTVGRAAEKFAADHSVLSALIGLKRRARPILRRVVKALEQAIAREAEMGLRPTLALRTLVTDALGFSKLDRDLGYRDARGAAGRLVGFG
jgi:hypothetical protein